MPQGELEAHEFLIRFPSGRDWFPVVVVARDRLTAIRRLARRHPNAILAADHVPDFLAKEAETPAG